jgi:ech hydrogenase subunit A
VDNKKLRTVLVAVTAVAIASTALLLLHRGPFELVVKKIFFIPLDHLILIGEIAVLCFIAYIAFRLKHLVIAILTAAQGILFLYLEFFLADSTDVAPAFYVDNLSLIMNLLISIVGGVVVVFALPYMNRYEADRGQEKSKQPRFFFFMLLILSAMNALVLTNNMVWLFFFWEVTTLCSYVLIGHNETAEDVLNATRALAVNMLGGVALLVGIIVVYNVQGTFSVQEIVQNGGAIPMMLLPLGLFCFAAFTKAAQIPFQSWLVGAMSAPAPVSALLHSSTMVKAGVYLVLRFAPAYSQTNLSSMVALVGGFTFVVASALAISQSNGKKILAYSTIANLGLIISCAGIDTPLSIAAAMLLIVFHGVSKALLFLCVGTVKQEIGSRDVEDMHGLFNKMPLTTIAATVGMLTMLLPPFGMFIGKKWSAMEAAPELPIVAIMLVMGSVLTVVFWLRWTGIMLTGACDTGEKIIIEKQHPIIRLSLFALVAGSLVLSVFMAPLFNKLIIPFIEAYYPDYSMEPDSLAIFHGFIGNFSVVAGVFVCLILIGLAFYQVLKRKHFRTVPVYLCGESSVCGSYDFCSIQDQWLPCRSSLYYLTSSLGEGKLSKPVDIVGIALLAVMIGVIFI